MITDVYAGRNGIVRCFDNGRYLREYSGDYRRLRELILKKTGENTNFYRQGWGNEFIVGFQRIEREWF